MDSTYILYSQSADRFYTGSCLNFEKRLSEHSSGKYGNAYTAIANDWITYLIIDDLDYHQARSIERHIKKMKSKKYIQNLNLMVLLNSCSSPSSTIYPNHSGFHILKMQDRGKSMSIDRILMFRHSFGSKFLIGF